jgi:hypothetical protein
MKYQVLSIAVGQIANPVELAHSFEMSASGLSELGEQVREMFADFGLNVISVRAVHRADIYEDWIPPEPPAALFDPEDLPRQRKRKRVSGAAS